MLFAAVL